MDTYKFNAWQIELTTRCPLRCTMCVKDTYRNWYRKDMELDNFLKILPFLKYTRTVVLEGWGESLMHPHIIDIVSMVKKQGCEVGFVTSGFGLDELCMDKLLQAGIDFIGFSFSGGTSETHSSIRINSNFDYLLNTVKTLVRKNLKKPKVHIVYLILKKNIHEMPTIVKVASYAGIKEVVFINITHITNKWQDSEKAFICRDEEEKAYKKTINNIIKETVKAAKKYNVKINLPNFFVTDVALCSENPLENLYISVDGKVSPCVYLYPPLENGFKRIFCGEEFKTNKLSFGNIFYEDIESIWNKAEYIAFRKRFYERRKKAQEIYNLLFEQKRLMDMTFPEPPELCRTCHKILGV
ncbi:MAG TPA: radical SAM protein [Syntrophorhabdaceae bacterium]|nr:radical SAM protein [Syntrophorhabdaceae bacterium]